MLDQRHALYQAANRIDWATLERGFEHLYSDIGSPALPTRLMAGLLLLKQLENLSDEPVIGHLKSDFRMARCFLKGAKGAAINLTLAAAAWNLKLWINEVLWQLIQRIWELLLTEPSSPNQRTKLNLA